MHRSKELQAILWRQVTQSHKSHRAPLLSYMRVPATPKLNSSKATSPQVRVIRQLGLIKHKVCHQLNLQRQLMLVTSSRSKLRRQLSVHASLSGTSLTIAQIVKSRELCDLLVHSVSLDSKLIVRRCSRRDTASASTKIVTWLPQPWGTSIDSI